MNLIVNKKRYGLIKEKSYDRFMQKWIDNNLMYPKHN